MMGHTRDLSRIKCSNGLMSTAERLRRVVRASVQEPIRREIGKPRCRGCAPIYSVVGKLGGTSERE